MKVPQGGTPSGPSFDDLRAAAQGRWQQILMQAGVPSKALQNKHGPCPGCGGRDRFRYDDDDGRGTWICGQGGGEPLAGDGFDLLVHAGKARDLAEAKQIVADAVGPLSQDNEKPGATSVTKITRHLYRKLDGTPHLMVERIEKPDGKTFRQYGTKKTPPSKIPGFKHVPYKVDRWAESMPPIVYIVEGEKCVEAMLERDLPATTNAGGAGNWPTELNEYFKDCDVRIIPDNDDAGRKHAIKVAEQLDSIASVSIVELPDLPPKGDVVDWFEAGHSTKELMALGSAAPRFQDWLTESQESTYKWIDASKDIQPILEGNWAIKGVLPAEGVGVIFGRPGCGKTFTTLDLALHVASGMDWRDCKTRQGAVAYLAMEAGRVGANRIYGWKEEHPGATPLLRMSPVLIDLRSSPEAIDALVTDLKAWQKNIPHPLKLVVVDTLNRAMAGGNENDSEDMGAFVHSCDRIAKELKCFVLIVHHSGKDEARGSRGHSSLLGAVNTEIEVKREQGEPGLLRVTKQRDGADGNEYGFELKGVKLGFDEDADEVTTCVVNECAVPTAKKKITAKHQKALLRCFEDAMRDHSEPAPQNMPGVVSYGRVTQLEIVRNAFLQNCTAANPRDAWGRAFEALTESEVLGTGNVYVWPGCRDYSISQG